MSNTVCIFCIITLFVKIKIEELSKAKRPPCNSDFMNKIEVRYNIR